MSKKIDIPTFEQQIFREIGKGHTTVALIAQALKMSNPSVKFRLDCMAAEGKLYKRMVSKVGYYTKCDLRAHDPFFLCKGADLECV